MEWINVNDRLPEFDEKVLLFDDWEATDSKTKYKDVRVGYLAEYTRRKTSDGVYTSIEWGGTEFAFNITHWMPQPEPPKQ